MRQFLRGHSSVQAAFEVKFILGPDRYQHEILQKARRAKGVNMFKPGKVQRMR